MKFESIRDAALALLEANASTGNYRVIGYPKPFEAAENISGVDRAVRFFYSGGDFPSSSSSENAGLVNHQMKFTIHLAVAAPASGDESVLTSLTATAAERAAALAGFSDAGYTADRELDDLFSVVWSLFMNFENRDILTDENAGSRWIPSFSKMPIDENGEYALSSGEMTLEYQADETPEGAAGEAGDSVSVDYGVDDDEEQATGQTFDISS